MKSFIVAAALVALGGCSNMGGFGSSTSGGMGMNMGMGEERGAGAQEYGVDSRIQDNIRGGHVWMR